MPADPQDKNDLTRKRPKIMEQDQIIDNTK